MEHLWASIFFRFLTSSHGGQSVFDLPFRKKHGQAEPRCLLQIGLQMIPEAVVKAYSRHWNPKKRSENCEAAME